MGFAGSNVLADTALSSSARRQSFCASDFSGLPAVLGMIAEKVFFPVVVFGLCSFAPLLLPRAAEFSFFSGVISKHPWLFFVFRFVFSFPLLFFLSFEKRTTTNKQRARRRRKKKAVNGVLSLSFVLLLEGLGCTRCKRHSGVRWYGHPCGHHWQDLTQTEVAFFIGTHTLLASSAK